MAGSARSRAYLARRRGRTLGPHEWRSSGSARLDGTASNHDMMEQSTIDPLPPKRAAARANPAAGHGTNEVATSAVACIDRLGETFRNRVVTPAFRHNALIERLPQPINHVMQRPFHRISTSYGRQKRRDDAAASCSRGPGFGMEDIAGDRSGLRGTVLIGGGGEAGQSGEAHRRDETDRRDEQDGDQHAHQAVGDRLVCM
jgi:hypothetical protein